MPRDRSTIVNADASPGSHGAPSGTAAPSTAARSSRTARATCASLPRTVTTAAPRAAACRARVGDALVAARRRLRRALGLGTSERRAEDAAVESTDCRSAAARRASSSLRKVAKAWPSLV